MRTNILILVILSCLYPDLSFADSTECFGVGGSALEEPGAHLKMDNRFEHCKKGDVINVYTKSLDKTEGDATYINVFAMRINEVASFCDYNYPVVFIGETKLPKNNLTARWFSCVYLGEKRTSRFHDSHE